MDAELDPEGLYHLATAPEWARYRSDGRIVPPSFEQEGFVHCSWGRQVPATVGRHFPGATDLLALRLDPVAVAGALVEEDTTGSGERFPHVYAPVPADAVVAVVTLA